MAQSQVQQERIAQLEAEVLHAKPATSNDVDSLVNSREDVDEDLCAQVCHPIAWLQQQNQSTGLWLTALWQSHHGVIAFNPKGSSAEAVMPWHVSLKPNRLCMSPEKTCICLTL